LESADLALAGDFRKKFPTTKGKTLRNQKLFFPFLASRAKLFRNKFLLKTKKMRKEMKTYGFSAYSYACGEHRDGEQRGRVTVLFIRLAWRVDLFAD